MARRNGQGPGQLQSVTERFRKGEQRLLRILEEEGLITTREREGLIDQITQAASQKRTTEVLDAAHTVHNKIIQVLRRGKVPSEQRERTELEVLYEINRLTQTCDQREPLFERLFALIQQVIQFENGTLFLVNRESKRLVIAGSHGDPVDLIGGVKFDFGFGFSSWVAKMRKPILLTELHRTRQPGCGAQVGSFLSVPLIVQNELIGVLNLSHPKTKSFAEEHLRILVLIAGQAASVIQRLLMYEEMERLAITDDLTGLWNRRHFLQHLQAECDRARRYDQPFSIAMIDIDHFKDVNDTLGHDIGDKILGEIGHLLRTGARSSDLPARYGGEEFAVLMPMTDEGRAYQAGERLRRMVADHVFPRRRKLSVSVGVASFPGCASNPQDLLKRADMALYEAKKGGRNRTVARNHSPVRLAVVPPAAETRVETDEPAIEPVQSATAA
jgi:diguanylate cyclase (GGDEF)-like protein